MYMAGNLWQNVIEWYQFRYLTPTSSENTAKWKKKVSPNFSKKFQIFQMRFLITFNDRKIKNEVPTDRKWAEDYNGVIVRWKNLI